MTILQLYIFQAHRWTKRGISLVPLKYNHSYTGLKFTAMLSVFKADGTVSVTHGGIEMGQGINTKVAQTVAKELGIGMDMIRVKASNNNAAPNNSITGGSTGSESCCRAALLACKDLKERLDKVKGEMTKPDPTWLEIVQTAVGKGVDIQSRIW